MYSLQIHKQAIVLTTRWGIKMYSLQNVLDCPALINFKHGIFRPCTDLIALTKDTWCARMYSLEIYGAARMYSLEILGARKIVLT